MSYEIITKKIRTDLVIIIASIIFVLMLTFRFIFSNSNFYWGVSISFIPMLGYSLKRLKLSRIESVEPADRIQPVHDAYSASSLASAGFGFSENLFVLILAICFIPFALVDLGIQIAKRTKHRTNEKI